MRNFKKWTLAMVMLLGFTAQGKGAEIFKNDDLDLSFGGRIQEMGEISLVTDDAVRNHFRLYLWNVEDRLYTNGNFKGFKWNFEASFGGESIANGTNGSFNLLDANIDIPIIPDSIYVKVGQFKLPGNLESAIYEGSQFFTEKSPNFNLFFNEGYDTGVALWGHLGQLDGQAGIVQGAPNLPQRYLPEIVNFPVPMFLRIGFNDGIGDDPFHPAQTGFTKPDKLQLAIHAMGYVAADSNAGHGDLFGQIGGGLATFNDNSYYGNVLTSKVFNPYLGLSGALPVTALYYQAGLDFQVRAPLADTTFTLSGQAMIGHFDTTITGGMIVNNAGGVPVTLVNNNGPLTIAGVVYPAGTAIGKNFSLNIGGAELIASIGDNPLEVAGRFAVLIPDVGMIGTYFTGKYNPIFVTSDPIIEVTLPSISYHFNTDVKLVAEAMFMFNEPEARDYDGNYVVAQMPGSGTGTTYTGPNIRASIVPIGRMMMQLQF
ncbi:MAG TPA: hypothetical protein VIJ93_10210 [bacterium]